jgi:hypothetical protein
MIVYCSTVFRTAPLEQGGELLRVNWDTKEVLSRVPIVPCDPMIPDPNPRGGTRGGRGIILYDDQVFVASYHSIHVFDRELRPIRTFSNRLFADIHELAPLNDTMWVTSTVLDGAVRVDHYGDTVETWWPREDEVVAGRFGLTPLRIDKREDNRLSYLGRSHVEPSHTHLNAITILDGRPLVLLNKQGCLVQLGPTRILSEDARLRGAHNLHVTADRKILVNDTCNQQLLVFNCNGQFERRVSLKSLWPVKRIRWRFAGRGLRLWLGERSPSFKLHWWLVGNIIASRPVFLRGMSETPHGTLLLGISPATILEIDLATGKLVSHLELSNDVNVAIHGLQCDEAVPASKLRQTSVSERELVDRAGRALAATA